MKPVEYVKQRRDSYIAALGGKCVVCGSTTDLEFDHIDPTTKIYSINAILTRKPHFVLEELVKCQLLCTEHHLEKTLREHKSFQHGTKMGWMRSKCHCALCDEQRQLWYLARNEKRRQGGQRGPYQKEPSHGTSAKYSRGCRCPDCRNANAKKERERLAKKNTLSS